MQVLLGSKWDATMKKLIEVEVWVLDGGSRLLRRSSVGGRPVVSHRNWEPLPSPRLLPGNRWWQPCPPEPLHSLPSPDSSTVTPPGPQQHPSGTLQQPSMSMLHLLGHFTNPLGQCPPDTPPLPPKITQVLTQTCLPQKKPLSSYLQPKFITDEIYSRAYRCLQKRLIILISVHHEQFSSLPPSLPPSPWQGNGIGSPSAHNIERPPSEHAPILKHIQTKCITNEDGPKFDIGRFWPFVQKTGIFYHQNSSVEIVQQIVCSGAMDYMVQLDHTTITPNTPSHIYQVCHPKYEVHHTKCNPKFNLNI